MKKIKLLSLAMLAMVFVMGSACKYEEGPALSLRTKTARLAGTWKVEKYIDNDGEESTPDAEDNSTWTFTKENTIEVSVSFLGQTTTFDGTWEWINSKEGVRVTIDYGSLGSESDDITILRLKNDELWTQDEDGDQTHFIPA
jgi:hypothetical protein